MNANDSSMLRAGVATADITTEDPGTRVRDALSAKALVLDDGATKVAIVAMDVVAIGGICDVRDDFLPTLRARIEADLGIPVRHVLVNASHTHPPGRIACDDDALLERTFDAVLRAASVTVPVRAGAGVGREERISMNRTLRMTDGSHWTVRHTNPSPPDELVESVADVDTDIGVLRFDREDGAPLAVVYSFACHPLFADPQGSVSANYVGVASKTIEDVLGNDATALFLQGSAGDVMDVHFKDFDRPRDVTPMGQMLGLSALEALRDLPTGDAALSVISEDLELPRRTDFPQRIEALEQQQAELLRSLRFTTLDFKQFLALYLRHALDPGHPAQASYRYMQEQKIGSDLLRGTDDVNRANIDKYLANIRAMERLARIQDQIATRRRHQTINEEAGSPTVTAEVQGIRIGDCILITSTTEVLSEVGLNIRRASPCPHTFVAAFSNGYIHYGAPAADYDLGGYEVVECLLAPEWQKMFEEKAAEIIGRLWAGK
ncbi:MAG: hypothetical protein CMJ18_22405 [Phycisphaeraceae bacterium]|nr:hypothetical protein [Phycisphaeraceae bacterium]